MNYLAPLRNLQTKAFVLILSIYQDSIIRLQNCEHFQKLRRQGQDHQAAADLLQQHPQGRHHYQEKVHCCQALQPIHIFL